MTRLVSVDRVGLDVMLRWRNDPRVTEHLATLAWTRDDAERWFESLGDTRLARAVEAEGRVVGYVQVDVDPVNRKGEVGVVLGEPSSWGRGVGTEAARHVTALAFDEAGLHRALAVASERNVASIRCFEKAGYREEGRLRDANLRGGEYLDLVLLSMLEPEWRASRAEA